MVRSELVQELAERHPDLRLRDVEAIVDTIFDAMVEELAAGGRVELRGFGAFSVRHRDAREGRNPRTGEPVAAPAKAVLHFKLGKGLHEAINPAA